MNGNSSVLLLQAVDVSGSMSGDVMAGINSAFQEWRAELNAYSSSFSKKVYWGEIRFAEEINVISPQEIESDSFDYIRNPISLDGFYETSEARALAEGLETYFNNQEFADLLNSTSKIIIHIFTDGLFTDDNLNEVFSRLESNPLFLDSTKKIVVCGEAGPLKQYSNLQLRKLSFKGQEIERISYEDFLREKGSILGELSKTDCAPQDPFESAFD